MNNFILFSDYAPLFDRVEQNFSAPFATVNAAMYHMITLSAGRQIAALTRDDTPGATRYSVRYPNGDLALIYVLQRNEALTTISIHPLVQRNGPGGWQPETLGYLGVLIGHCCEEVTRAMRYTHPDFTLRPHELAPPMPSWNDNPKGALIWRGVYARDMSDEEFAGRLGVQLQTLYNAKSKYGFARTARGKSQRKVSKKR